MIILVWQFVFFWQSNPKSDIGTAFKTYLADWKKVEIKLNNFDKKVEKKVDKKVEQIWNKVYIYFFLIE